MTDLLFDVDALGGDMLVECRISAGPRSEDPTFDPRPDDLVRIDDGEERPLPAIVLRRNGDRVLVRVLEPTIDEVELVRTVLWAPPPGRRRLRPRPRRRGR